MRRIYAINIELCLLCNLDGITFLLIFAAQFKTKAENAKQLENRQLEFKIITKLILL
mgnify:CR=1 FL=1